MFIQKQTKHWSERIFMKGFQGSEFYHKGLFLNQEHFAEDCQKQTEKQSTDSQFCLLHNLFPVRTIPNTEQQ